MFEFYGYRISVSRAAEGLLVRLYPDADDEPIDYYSPNSDPYYAAALLQTDLELEREEEIIRLGQLIDAYL